MDKNLTFLSKITKALRISEGGTISKMKASIFSIILGFALGILPILYAGGDIALTYTTLFISPFISGNINSTLIVIAIFILLGTGIAISFNAGLFNIGAPGQFLLSGTFTIMIGISNDFSKPAAIPLMILVSALTGAAVAALAGALKAYFNVHEVVSTILINWIIFFFVKWMMGSSHGVYKSSNNDNSKMIHSGFQINGSSTGTDFWWVIMLTLFLVIIISLILKYTTFGYRIKANGLNTDAVKYAGINDRAIKIISMAISGAFAGIAGYMFYAYKHQMPPIYTLPNIGFESITITLLAFANPILCIPFGILFGIISEGVSAAGLAGAVSAETIALTKGIIIFIAAFSPAFIKLRPIEKLKKSIFFMRCQDVIDSRKNLKSELSQHKTIFKDQIENIRIDNHISKTRIQEIKVEYIKGTKEYDDFMKENNVKFEVYKITKKEWRNDLRELKQRYKKKNIDIIQYGASVKEKNNFYAAKIVNEELNPIEQVRKSYKIQRNNIISNHKLFKEEEWTKHLNKKLGDA